ncbi:MAG TPA: PQQ-binding-like beta-propeller repeat protein [Verrucomicrobiae bacterium]
MSQSAQDTPPRKGLRWWPAAVILGLGAAASTWVRAHKDWSFQQHTLGTLAVFLISFVLLFVWWCALSRTPRKLRLAGVALVVGSVILAAALFRVRGFSGDVLPILEPRWATRPAFELPAQIPAPSAPAEIPPALDFPQFLGPDRTAVLSDHPLEPDWLANPPRVLWRQPVGAAWSGWAIVGRRAFTQEQRPEGECATSYDLSTGRLLWTHADPARYQTALAGEGPRCTPTVVSNRVFTLGATGILNCLDATDGKLLWTHNLVEDANSRVPEWGFAGSPLVFDGKVVVCAGGSPDRSLLAYGADTGGLEWSAGNQWISYSSPFLATLAGRRQILAFNSRAISAHDAISGQVLWEYPWGIGQPQVSVPVVVGPNRVLFSSAYGVGSILLEITGLDTGLRAAPVWQSKKMKSKFATLVQRDGFLYGLDDGVLACLDLKDGSQRWKEGRYGHGQGLLVNDLLLLMDEGGELVLLQPAPDAPHELHRFRVFHGKTWNPIALSGALLLARTDQEAACLQLPLANTARSINAPQSQ